MTLAIPASVTAPGKPAQSTVVRLPPNFRVQGPLVSCLMVSRGKRFPASYAIQCYREQSYTNRELVIVTAERDSEVGALVREIGDDTIRYIEVEPRTLGELRNGTVAHARGEYVSIWDDDDLSHPDRLSCQIAALGLTGAKACFVEQILLWWPARRLLRLSAARMWEGSMMAARDAIPVYPALRREEDLFVVNAIARLHRTVSVRLPYSYCYVVHGGNTNNATHFEAMYRDTFSLPGARDYAAGLAKISSRFPLAEYERSLHLERAASDA